MIDVLVTSVKPFCGGAHSERQLECLRQMGNVARYVFVFNKPEDLGEYANEFRLIAPFANPPTIHQILNFATASTAGSIGMVNGDIFLTEAVAGVPHIGRRLGRVWAATSFRWENGAIEGQGLDLFLMSGRVAEEVLKVTPPFLTLGRTHWDNWMNGWLRKHLRPAHYFDITDWKCVLHAPHERPPNRLSNYSEEQVAQLLHDVSCGGIPNQKYAQPR